MNYLELRETIVSSAARALFVQWWADQCSCGGDAENCRLEGDGDEDWDASLDHTPNDQGGELMDYAPETTSEALACAERFIAMVEGRQEMAISKLLARTLGDEGIFTTNQNIEDQKATDFGHCLAMTAVGHGVFWTDSHPMPKHSIRGPDIQFNGDCWAVIARLTSILVCGQDEGS